MSVTRKAGKRDTAPPVVRDKPKGLYLRKGKWWWLAVQRKGKRRFFSLETMDYSTAVTRAAQLLRQPDLAASDSWTTERDAYLAHRQRLNQYSRRSCDVVRWSLDKLRAFHPCPRPSDITHDIAKAFYEHLQSTVKETSAQRYMNACRSFFRWAADVRRILPRNPFEGIALATIDEPARVTFCDPATVARIFNANPPDPFRIIFLLGFHCGMRKGEIIEARRDWFDFDARCVHVQRTATFRPKDREARTIPLTSDAVTFLRPQLQPLAPHDFVLMPEVGHGRNIYRWDYERPWRTWLNELGLRWVSSHVMRHTFASLLLQRGVSVYKVAKWMGDRVDVVQKHYGHLTPQDSDIEVLTSFSGPTTSALPAAATPPSPPDPPPHPAPPDQN